MRQDRAANKTNHKEPFFLTKKFNNDKKKRLVFKDANSIWHHYPGTRTLAFIHVKRPYFKNALYYTARREVFSHSEWTHPSHSQQFKALPGGIRYSRGQELAPTEDN